MKESDRMLKAMRSRQRISWIILVVTFVFIMLLGYKLNTEIKEVGLKNIIMNIWEGEVNPKS